MPDGSYRVLSLTCLGFGRIVRRAILRLPDLKRTTAGLVEEMAEASVSPNGLDKLVLLFVAATRSWSVLR